VSDGRAEGNTPVVPAALIIGPGDRFSTDLTSHTTSPASSMTDGWDGRVGRPPQQRALKAVSAMGIA
jgi:hypothetical protein